MNTELVREVESIFINTFSTQPLIVFSPGRINLIGEHTDYNDGFAFPAAIDKGVVAAIQKSDSNYCILHAFNKIETYEFSLDTILPIGNGGWRNYILGVVGEIQKKGYQLGNFNLAFGGDIPSGAGMSSSAALENSIVFGLNELFQLGLSKEEMIFISQQAEHNYVGVKCGIMDQYASMFGKRNSVLLLDCRTIEAIPYKINFKEYQLLLINTNVKHNLSDSAYNDRRSICENIAEMLEIKALRDATKIDLESIKNRISEEDYQKALYVIQENDRVIQASEAIKEDDLESLGQLLYQSHQGLKTQYKVSCAELDFLVEQAKLSGDVLGARMMGGGFGGCTINLIAKNKSNAFKETVSEAYEKEFGKDCSIFFMELSEGTQLIEMDEL